MVILEFEAINCNRFSVPDIRGLKVTFTEVVQLILGTNGSGKSSMIQLMTPLAADRKDFYKDGSRTIKIAHRGEIYTAKSWFSPGPKHSLKRGDEELNPGGTAAEQNDLCKQIFGITPEIHKLLTGQIRFTEMEISERRKWFMLLSESDWDFAMKIYNDLGTYARDIEGQLRGIKKRLVLETEKVISPVEEKKLFDEVNQLHRELQLLMEVRAPVETPVKDLQEQNRIRLDELDKLSKQLLKMRFVAPYGHRLSGPKVRNEWGELQRPSYQSIEEVEIVIEELKTEIVKREALLNNFVTEHQKCSEQLAILMKTGEATVTNLRESLASKRQQQLTMLDQRRLKLELGSSVTALAAIASVEEQLTDIFTNLSENSDQTYSSAKMDKADKAVVSLNEKIRDTEHWLRKKRAEKEHLEVHRQSAETNCPKCSHRFTIGFSEAKYKNLCENVAELETELASAKEELAKQQALYESNANYGKLYRGFYKVKANWPSLNPFWDYVINERHITHRPRQVLFDLQTLKADLVIDGDVEKIGEEIVEIKRLLVAKEELGDANLTKVKEQHEELTIQIERLTYELKTLSTSHNEHREYRQNLTEATQLAKRITQLRKEGEACLQTTVEMMRRETIAHCMRQLQSALGRKEEVLTYVTSQKGLVEDLHNQLRELEVRETAAKLLVTNLSPKEGLIADGLLGFIHSFLDQINSLIKKIWTYPMTVEDCAAENTQFTELDFKFPLRTERKVVSDVKLGSSGQTEIIDLAFKVSAMARLGLMESPLFLDEFGKTFDMKHRHQATMVINALMEQKPFTQLFMVSHYEESFGAFSKPEVCVLCPSNVIVPKSMEYNQHVTFA